MLQHLQIQNYALIEHLNIDFHNGFSVITGETGAGKSIILGALELLLGKRFDVKCIKDSSVKCIIEAEFKVDSLDYESFFSIHDIDFEGGVILVRRELRNTGKSRAFINDTPVSLTILKDLGKKVIDIHSQHQNLLVEEENFIIDLIDNIAENNSIRLKYRTLFQKWEKSSKDLMILKEKAQKDKFEKDFLQFQYNELSSAKLYIGEQEELENESDLIRHAEEIKQTIYQTVAFMNKEDSNILDELRSSVQRLQKIESIFPRIISLSDRMESARIELEDIVNNLDYLSNDLDVDKEKQDIIEDRLDTIYGLEKKHNVSTIEDLLNIEEKLRERLDYIDEWDELINKKNKEVEDLYKILSSLSKELSLSRKKMATAIEKQVKITLEDLGILHGKIKFKFDKKEKLTIAGEDSIDFLFSANKNIPLQNVAQTASGGEIARLMLALKALVSQKKTLSTLIFDEIDTGVSGTIAEKMAKIMFDISTKCQVICVTHLPQVAASGQYHYKVYKEENKERAQTGIKCLSIKERVTEIANMLSGEQITDAAINNAKSLLNIQ